MFKPTTAHRWFKTKMQQQRHWSLLLLWELLSRYAPTTIAVAAVIPLRGHTTVTAGTTGNTMPLVIVVVIAVLGPAQAATIRTDVEVHSITRSGSPVEAGEYRASVRNGRRIVYKADIPVLIEARGGSMKKAGASLHQPSFATLRRQYIRGRR